MLVTHDWLSEYVDLPPADELPDLLTKLGHAPGRSEPGVLDLEILSNRPDCLGVIGVAREIAAATGRKLRAPSPALKESDVAVGQFVSVEVEAPELCPRYIARAVYEVKVGPSPDWLRQRLESVGVRPINNIVDATNYVLMEYGQPLHAFDATALRGKKIVVRRARAGEKIRAIDGREYALDAETLVIADAQAPVAIAGVMGGLDSEIGAGTRTVIIESAQFHGPSIRRTARKLGLHSPSSYRFERGVAWSGVEAASRRAAELMGGKLAKGSIDVAVKPARRRPIRLRPAQVERVLGMRVPAARVRGILSALGFVKGVPPDWRRDLNIEEDLIEEIARLVGYDKIPDDATFPEQPAPRARERVVEQRIRELLMRAGAQEVLTRTFGAAAGGAVRLRGTDLAMRTSLVPGLLKVLETNEAYREPAQPVFEIAKVYDGAGPSERTVVGIAAAGLRRVQGIVEALVAALTGATLAVEPREARAAALAIGGRKLGWIAEREGGSTAELYFDAFSEAAVLDRRLGELARFPAIERDLALIVEAATPWRRIEQVVLGAAPANIESVEFFDVYTGKQVADGKKSVAFRLRFRRADRTLTHAEVDAEVGRVVGVLERELGGTLRA